MGLDTPSSMPTTAGGAFTSAAANNGGGGSGSQPQQQQPHNNFGDPFGSSAAAEGEQSKKADEQQQQQQTIMGEDIGDGQPAGSGEEEQLGNFPEDLDGIGPLANLTNTPGIGSSSGPQQQAAHLLDPKTEPFFGFGAHLQAPGSVNGLLHQHQQQLQQQQAQQLFNGPGSAPAGPCSADSSGGHSSSGDNNQRRPGSTANRLVIRDPFAPDQPPPAFASLQAAASREAQAPLTWDGKPPEDAKSMAELARVATDPMRPPMMPVPNMKEGGIQPGTVLPQWSFYSTPMHRQRLEQLYPAGTFPPGYWSRWQPMPVPPMVRPMMPATGRVMFIQVRPGMQVPPLPPWLAGRIPPNVIPVVMVPGPNGQLLPIPVNPATLIPPPGIGPPPGQQPGTQQQQPSTPANPSGNPSAAGGSGGGKAGTGSTQQQQQPAKPKKESAKQRKQREKLEEQQRQQQQEREQQQQQMAAMGRSPSLDGGGPPPGFYLTPPHGMAGGGPMSAGGPAGQQQQQQQDCFKVPGRSPPLKRCTSSLTPSGPGSVPLQQHHQQQQPPPFQLMPMPDQRIHAQGGHCYTCQNEINPQRKAIQCTAMSQGCNNLFHWDCAGLSPEAFTEFCRDSRLEWICQSCFQTRTKEQCLMFAC